MQLSDYNLLVVAHPDDEVLFFTAALLQMRQHPWHVIVVTDANADGRGPVRADEFRQVMQSLGVDHYQLWDFPDVFEKRLDIDRLVKRLAELDPPDLVFTHSPVGEYMHPHHQDVSYGVHRVFHENHTIYCPAYNCFPDKILQLGPDAYRLKCSLLTEVYGDETRRFLNLLPATATESFCQLEFTEVEAIYQCLLGKLPELWPEPLDRYRWLADFLIAAAKKSSQRLF